VKNLILSISAILALVACSPENKIINGYRPIPAAPKQEIPEDNRVTAPPLTYVLVDGGQSQMEFNPKVDILFVVDNSNSMEAVQSNLSRNIDSFASKFHQNKMIDYQIGVTSVWDSSRFTEGKDKNGFSLGELRNVKKASGAITNSRFVTKKSNSTGVLAQTLKIGYMPPGSGGPENEEIFSPISAAIKLNGRGAQNEGFFRDDARLVVIIISDAEDSTPGISPEQLAQELFDFKGGSKGKVSVYAAIIRKSDPEDKKDDGLKVLRRYHPECFDQKGVRLTNNERCNQGFGADRIEEFVLAANVEQGSAQEIRKNNLMSIVKKEFGEDLARIGSDISIKTLEKEILLPFTPRQDTDGSLMIKVRYGTPEELALNKGQIIPQSQKGGWVFDPENNSILLSGDVTYTHQEGARFAVEMVPVTVRD
jgi:hypothetical protein